MNTKDYNKCLLKNFMMASKGGKEKRKSSKSVCLPVSSFGRSRWCVRDKTKGTCRGYLDVILHLSLGMVLYKGANTLPSLHLQSYKSKNGGAESYIYKPALRTPATTIAARFLFLFISAVFFFLISDLIFKCLL